MLKIYGTSLSSPSNKIRFCADLLQIPHQFIEINLRSGEHKSPEFTKMNPFGKVPAIDDEGFTLSESNTILRYMAEKQQSDLYPRDLKERAKVDQWLDYAGLHVAMATSKIMFNMYFYKLVGSEIDKRSLEDGKMFLNNYLPIIEKQLSENTFIAGPKMSIADISMLAALDVCEVIDVDLSTYTHLTKWRNKLMSEGFYQKTHQNYAETLNKVMKAA